MNLFSVPATDSNILLLSNKPNPIWPNTPKVTLTCVVKLNAHVAEDLSMLEVDVQFFRNTIPLAPADLQLNSTTFTYTMYLDSFVRNDSGNYMCRATVTPHENSTHLTGNITITSSTDLSTGEQSNKFILPLAK